jgi:hypothetical protein
MLNRGIVTAVPSSLMMQTEIAEGKQISLSYSLNFLLKNKCEKERGKYLKIFQKYKIQ